MSEPLRTDPANPQDAPLEPDQTAKIEQLLLDGLDHYFSAQYDQAINVWTRALFLDRSHARARAYIERARAALSERQRESEELLQSGVAAFDRGESIEARRLLEDAIRRGAPMDEALAVLGRIDRFEPKAPFVQPLTGVGDAHRPTPVPPTAPRESPASRAWLAMVGVAVAALGVVLLLGLVGIESILPPLDAPIDLRPSPRDAVTLPLPLRGEVALERARALAASGRLHDAIAVLGAVRDTDARKPEADRLTGDLQRQLIELAPSTVPLPERPATDPEP